MAECKVTIHSGMALNGAIAGFEMDIDAYYSIQNGLGRDAVLMGADTILAVPDALPPEKDEDMRRRRVEDGDDRPYLIIPDSRGRLKGYLHAYRGMIYIKDIIVLVSDATPKEYIDYLRERDYEHYGTQGEHVDLGTALELLAERRGIRRVITDAGPTLNGVMLNQGLVDEISLIIVPHIGGDRGKELFRDVASDIGLELISSRKLKGGSVHLRYRVQKGRTANNEVHDRP